ncbi:hypothetical protein WJX84_005703 [Apatococcus fuscideae]|uniref:Uncharacterized protein n=1 Tax=Apatococcus fuscideae TaxID=2026836 RepID=A0AAW1TCK1_9CHLO
MCDVRVCHFVRAFGTRSVWVDSFISTNYVALTQQADRTNPEESDTRWSITEDGSYPYMAPPAPPRPTSPLAACLQGTSAFKASPRRPQTDGEAMSQGLGPGSYDPHVEAVRPKTCRTLPFNHQTDRPGSPTTASPLQAQPEEDPAGGHPGDTEVSGGPWERGCTESTQQHVRGVLPWGSPNAARRLEDGNAPIQLHIPPNFAAMLAASEGRLVSLHACTGIMARDLRAAKTARPATQGGRGSRGRQQHRRGRTAGPPTQHYGSGPDPFSARRPTAGARPATAVPWQSTAQAGLELLKDAAARASTPSSLSPKIKGVPFSKLQGWHGPHEQARSAEKRRGPAEGPWSGLTEPNVMVIPSGSRPVPEIALGQGFPRMFPGGSEVLELDDDVGTSRSSQLSALGTRNLTHPETSEGRAAEAGRPLHPAHGGGISADPDSTSRLSLVPSPDSDANVGRVVSNSHRPGGSAGSETSVQLSPSAGPESSAGSGDTSPVIPSRRPGSSSGPITSFEGLPGQYSNMAAIPEDRPVRGSAGLSADADMGCEASGPRHDVVGLPGTASGLEASLEVSPDSSPAMSHPGLEISSAAQTTTNIAASSGRRHTSDPDMRLDASPQPDTLATDDDLADPATSYEHAMGPGSDISGGSETDSELEISFRPGSSAGDPVDMLAAVSGMDSNAALIPERRLSQQPVPALSLPAFKQTLPRRSSGSSSQLPWREAPQTPRSPQGSICLTNDRARFREVMTM